MWVGSVVWVGPVMWVRLVMKVGFCDVGWGQ